MESDLVHPANLIDTWNIVLNPISPYTIISIIIVVLLLICSALISGSEVAYFSLNKSDKNKLNPDKNRTDYWVLKNLQTPEKLLATILTSNNFVNIGIVILTTFIFNKIVVIQNAPIFEFIVQVILITFFILLFGEILPKVYASHSNLKVARFMAYPLGLLQILFSPLNSILLLTSNLVHKKIKKRNTEISMDHISQALELTSEKEISDEREILQGIVKFGNKSVAEIKKPRVDVIAIGLSSSFSDVLKIINESGYSRIPVYSESFDDIKGILYIKDLLQHSHKGNAFKWQTLIRPPFYVPDTKKISSLLEEFQKNKVHLAIVVDEYGGTSGIVTLEDILEEIVGEISDEFDEDEKLFTKLSDNLFLIDGKILLGDFCRLLNCDDEIFENIKGEADTLAGLILEMKGEIPVKNDKIEYKPFIFTIESVDDRRIKQVKVKMEK